MVSCLPWKQGWQVSSCVAECRGDIVLLPRRLNVQWIVRVWRRGSMFRNGEQVGPPLCGEVEVCFERLVFICIARARTSSALRAVGQRACGGSVRIAFVLSSVLSDDRAGELELVC